jgi:hypothetical protein
MWFVRVGIHYGLAELKRGAVAEGVVVVAELHHYVRSNTHFHRASPFVPTCLCPLDGWQTKSHKVWQPAIKKSEGMDRGTRGKMNFGQVWKKYQLFCFV